MLARYDESGVGRIWNSDPFAHGNPWVVQAEFDLEPVVTLPGPSAMRIPVGLTRADIRDFANWKPLAERRNPFVCSAGRWRDDVEIVLPASAQPMFVPAGVAIESGAFRYQSQWRLEGDRLKRSGSANSDTGIKKSDSLAQLGEDFACTRRADREKSPSQPAAGRRSPLVWPDDG